MAHRNKAPRNTSKSFKTHKLFTCSSATDHVNLEDRKTLPSHTHISKMLKISFMHFSQFCSMAICQATLQTSASLVPDAEILLPLLNLQEERICSLHLQFVHGPKDMQRCIESIVGHLQQSLTEIRTEKLEEKQVGKGAGTVFLTKAKMCMPPWSFAQMRKRRKAATMASKGKIRMQLQQHHRSYI